ncbi:MAG: cysteine hydrolase family protein [Acidimicrobiia bacterium]
MTVQGEDGLEAREWWTFVPEEERALYMRAGFGKPEPLSGECALVVVDTTLAFTGTRPLPVHEAVEQEFATSCGEHAWAALPYIEALLSSFRGAGLPVVFTRLDTSGQSALRGATKRAKDDRVAAGNTFLEQVKPLDSEWICEKARASAFYGTILDTYLRLNSVETVVLCGGSTSGCVRASAADAFSAGFRVIVAEDATFDRARHPHLANLFDINAKYGTVMRARQIVEQVSALAGSQQ